MARRESTGRPSAFGRPAVRQKFLKALRSGSTIKMACAYAGLSDAAYYRFMAQDHKPADMTEDVWVKFRDDIMQATEKGMAEMLYSVASDPDWRAKAWVMERRKPEVFGKVDRHEITGRDGGPVSMVNLSELPDDVVMLLAEAAEKSQGEPGDGE